MTTPRRLRRVATTTTVDPYWNDVILLLRSNDDFTGTINTSIQYLDSTNTRRGLAADGVIGWSRTSPFATGAGAFVTAATALGGSRGFLTTPSNDSGLEMTGDFTIEFFGMVPAGTSQTTWSGAVTTSNNNGITSSDSGNGQWSITGFGSPNWGRNSSGVAAADGVWRHIALTRSGTTVRGFIDGTQFHTQLGVTGTVDLRNTRFGKGTGDAADNLYNGYLSNIRISNIARYTDAFTRPSDYFAWDANTVLLLRGDEGLIYDYGPLKTPVFTNGNSYTRETTVKKFGNNTINTLTNPGNNHAIIWPRASTTAGQGFLQSSDLQCPGDFTWECWFRIASGQSIPFVMVLTRNTTSTASLAILAGDGGGNDPTIFGPGLGTQTMPSDTNINDDLWHHMALVRSGTGSNNVVAYLDGVAKLTWTSTTTISFAATAGGYVSFFGQFDAAAAFQPPGYLDSIRITRGVARYTGNFTPPAVAFPTQ